MLVHTQILGLEWCADKAGLLHTSVFVRTHESPDGFNVKTTNNVTEVLSPLAIENMIGMYRRRGSSPPSCGTPVGSSS